MVSVQKETPSIGSTKAALPYVATVRCDYSFLLELLAKLHLVSRLPTAGQAIRLRIGLA